MAFSMKLNLKTTARKFGHLLFGSLGSQLLILLSMPVLTRLYTVDNFGVYGTYLAFVNVASVFATFRYERGIVVANDIAEAYSVFFVTLLIAVLMIPISYAIILIWSGNSLWQDFVLNDLFIYFPIIVALAIGFSGAESAFRYLALKQQGYRALGLTQISRSVLMVSVQILLVFVVLPVSEYGLVVGAAIAPGFVALVLFLWLRKQKWLSGQRIGFSFKSIYHAAKKNTIYPKYMVWSALLNSLTNAAPILILGGLFSNAVVGAVFLAFRVLMAPTRLISLNFSLVNLQEAAGLSGKKMTYLYHRRIKKICLLGAIPFLIAIIFSPYIFGILFGKEWTKAGEYARLLSPAVYTQFVMMSFLTLFTALKAQKTYLAWSFGRVILVVSALLVGAHFDGIHGSLIGFTIASMVSYFVAHILIINRLASAEKEWKNIAE